MSLSFQLIGISCLSVAAICRWHMSIMMHLSATCQEVTISRLIFVGLQRPRVCALAHKMSHKQISEIYIEFRNKSERSI